MKPTLFAVALLVAQATFAQTPAPAYGAPISLEDAKKVVKAAETFAASKQWPVVIVIVDTSGNLVLLQKADNTQVGSVDVAIAKAKTANNFKRSTKAFEDALAAGGIGLRVLTVPNVIAVEGGELIIVDGKIVGAIGVSGVQANQDGEVARAGLAVLK